MRRFKVRAASVSDPEWLINRRGVECILLSMLWVIFLGSRSDDFPATTLGSSIAPVNLLFFGENGFYIFNQLKKRRPVLQASIAISTIQIESTLPYSARDEQQRFVALNLGGARRSKLSK
jgi:hypothetical protein